MKSSSSSLIYGLGLALMTLLLDQLSKIWLLDMMMQAGGPIEVLPFFNLVMVWNHGISFGMFAGDGDNAKLLIAIAGVIVLVLLRWLKNAPCRFISTGLGLIIGGAIGNIIDRVRFGAVADFFDFHLAGKHWPAFNIADSAIFIGVVLLCWDSLFRQETDKKTTAEGADA